MATASKRGTSRTVAFASAALERFYMAALAMRGRCNRGARRQNSTRLWDYRFPAEAVVVSVPWEVLESRAFTTTTQNDGSEMQRPILQRLFGPGIMDTLGVRMDSVPVRAHGMAASSPPALIRLR